MVKPICWLCPLWCIDIPLAAFSLVAPLRAHRAISTNMEASFLGVPNVDVWVFFGLTAAAFITTILGATLGTAGGLALLAFMALFFPPVVLVPVHTVVQLGAGISRAVFMWRYVLQGTLIPFLIGAAVGAAVGAQLFISLSTGVLQGLIGSMVLLLTWAPQISRVGRESYRFLVIGFIATLVGMFVSATGTLVSAFLAGASPDRRNLVATQGAQLVIVHTAKLMAFGFLGLAIASYTPLILAMIAAAVAANWLGSRVIVLVSEKSFRVIFRILISLLALRLLWVAAGEMGLI